MTWLAVSARPSDEEVSNAVLESIEAGRPQTAVIGGGGKKGVAATPGSGWGLADIARHVIGCHSTQETRIYNAWR